MASARLLQSNFASGELSPRIIASGDLERYGAGLALALNLQILPLGAAERRSGSIWAEDPRDPAKTGRLLPFVRNVGDAVAIVICDGKLRFIEAATASYLRDESDDVVEVSCAWTEADYPHLFSWQSADVMWIGDRRGGANVQVLKRVAGEWQALSELQCRNGPFLPDEDGELEINMLATPATLEITSGAAEFGADHVGALVGTRENTGAPGVKRWVSGEAVTSTQMRYNAGRVYMAFNSGTTGNNSPIHDEGRVSDGAVSWVYVHDGLGVVRITSVIDGSHAEGEIEAELPSEQTTYWGFGAFSDAAGWPSAGVIHHERMVLGGALSGPDVTYASRVTGYGPDFADFKAGLGTGLVTDADAVRRALGSGTVQQILHYVSFERLYVFTSEGVHLLSGPSLDEPITPAGASARERCAFAAAADVAPVKTGDSILYVTAGREQIREILRDGADTPSVTVLVDHLMGRGVAEIGFVQSPTPALWTRFDDGGLGSMTYERLERVRAWAQHQLGGGGEVTSVIVLPDPDGRQSVWCYVRRVIDGAARYSIEYIPPAWNCYREPVEQACSLDAAGYFDFWNDAAGNRARFTWHDEAAGVVTLETEQNTFAGGDVGRRFALRLAAPAAGFDAGEAARIARVDVAEFIDAKTVRGRLVTPGADALPGAWTVHWARMETALNVGARLEGQSVDVFADGSAYLDAVVEDGEIELDEPVARGWVGLRNRFALRDLPIAQGSPIGAAFGPVKKIDRLWIVAQYATPGCVVVNPDSGAETELVWRHADDPTDRPPTPAAGYHMLLPKGAWSETGQIEIRQDAPFPVLILGIVKEAALS
ncbi:MAG: hypothetical protein BroJett013_30540 [Alphaproteobacteria bacterium]|nr:MAG: hypothetical protein BroJett013_30540 [Alphaproteobacteria bacterium]